MARTAGIGLAGLALLFGATGCETVNSYGPKGEHYGSRRMVSPGNTALIAAGAAVVGGIIGHEIGANSRSGGGDGCYGCPPPVVERPVYVDRPVYVPGPPVVVDRPVYVPVPVHQPMPVYDAWGNLIGYR